MNSVAVFASIWGEAMTAWDRHQATSTLQHLASPDSSVYCCNDVLPYLPYRTQVDLFKPKLFAESDAEILEGVTYFREQLSGAHFLPPFS